MSGLHPLYFLDALDAQELPAMKKYSVPNVLETIQPKSRVLRLLFILAG
jgi:hypothetical protein